MARRKRSKADQTRVAGYVRVSTEGQAEEGVSLDAQREAIGAYCRMRGLELVEIVTDAGVSAGKPLATREGGARVLDMVRRREVGGVVAMKLDRLFRNAIDCLENVETWGQAGVALHVIDMGGASVDTSCAMGWMFMSMAASFAQMERMLISERTRMGLQQNKAQGKRVGQIPFGFRLAADGEALEQDPDEQFMLQRILRLRAEGVSVPRIVALLNADESASPRGEKWHNTTVYRLLERAAA